MPIYVNFCIMAHLHSRRQIPIPIVMPVTYNDPNTNSKPDVYIVLYRNGQHCTVSDSDSNLNCPVSVWDQDQYWNLSPAIWMDHLPT